MIRCAWYRWRWSSRREWGRAPGRAVQLHLARCEGCRRFVSEVEWLDYCLQGHSSPRSDDATAVQRWARLERALHAAPVREANRRLVSWAPRWARGAVLVLLMAGLGLWGGRGRRSDPVRREAPAQEEALAALGRALMWADRWQQWLAVVDQSLVRGFGEVGSGGWFRFMLEAVSTWQALEPIPLGSPPAHPQ